MATTVETVTSFYKNVLGRDPDADGLAFWVSRIDNGTSSVAEVVAGFTGSQEAISQVNPIVDLYFSALGRAPDEEGLQNWINARHNGMSLEQIALSFTQSAEFAQVAASSDSEFVATLYQNALGRTPEADGLAHWMNQLAAGMSRDQVLTAITNSQESQALTGVKSQIVLAYNGVLGHMPTAAQADAIVQNQGQKSLTELITATANDLLAGADDTPVIPTPPPSVPTEAIFTPNPGTTAGSSDASTAIALDDKYMIVADDEGNVLRVYARDGGDAVYEWDYSAALGISGEVDLEAATLVGDTLYLTGSHSNSKKGADADSREVLFSVKVSGTGADTQFSYQGKFTGLEAALVAWDQSGASGKAAGYFGFAESSGVGTTPENTYGFSIEGMTTSADDGQLWLGFRAPQTDTATRDKALIVPVDNYQALVNGIDTTPQFGTAIELNLGGRGIRSIDKAADGSGYLILAGPSGSASDAVTHDFRLFTWDGNADSQPLELDNDLDALLAATGGSFESIVSPASIKAGTQIQLLQDNGDTIWPGQTEVSKDLDPEAQQFKGNLITLGAVTTDATAPTLVSASPADGESGIPIASTLSLTFDEGVAMGSGTIQLQDAAGNLVQSFAAGDAQLKVNYNSIALQPTAPLQSATDYKLIVGPDAVTDHAGNALAGKTLAFTTGEKVEHNILITEVNSNAQGGDFFEVYNYGSTTIDLSGWKMDDDSASFTDSAAVALPGGLTLAAGQSLVVALVKADGLSAFKAAWNLDDSDQVIGIDGPGLGKKDAVVLFDSSGNVATAFSYGAASLTASDGTLITQALTNTGFVDDQHAGAAYGSTATASAIWDMVSAKDPHYVGAMAGQLGAFAQAGSPAAVGSPGIVEIVQIGISSGLEESLVA